MSGSVCVVLPVYEDGERALDAIGSLLRQALPDGLTMDILVVDDGSKDDTAERIAGVCDQRVELLRLEENRGRSQARNAGSQGSRSQYLVFVDCDCAPTTDWFLSEHVASLKAGAVASTGPVSGSGRGFWDRYQRDASRRRKRQFDNGCTCSGSSQNLAVLRSAFEDVGGFDTTYRQYGFEDRDLLLRLAEIGDIAWTASAEVRHLDALHLQDVCRKMTESGQHSSARFAARHPSAYRQLGYAAVDCRQRTWLRPLASLLGPRMPALAACVEPALHRRWIPYPLRKGMVKVASAVAFMYGTTRAD